MNMSFPKSDKELKEAWRVAELMSKYIRKDISIEEQKELDEWRLHSAHNQNLFDELTDEKNVEKAKEWILSVEVEKKKVLSELKRRLPFNPPRRETRLNFWWVAASLITGLSIAAFIYYKKPFTTKTDNVIIRSADVPPGENVATLQLSDGSIIDLKKQRIGKLESKEEYISKVGEGGIKYEDSAIASQNLFNLLSTPVGGQYSVELPDGSKAWLNASSSLKYPLSFKKQRTVEATGEVYFEVAKDKIPFIVKSTGATIEVLGTHFNVNSYEKVKTTLLEGSVRLKSDSGFKILKPGEMGVVDQTITVKKLDYPEDLIAWKNGYFRFTHENIKEIMAQLARWYKIDVSYEGNFEQTTFTATARRDENISTILRKIEKAGHIHFTIEGTLVKVQP